MLMVKWRECLKFILQPVLQSGYFVRQKQYIQFSLAASNAVTVHGYKRESLDIFLETITVVTVNVKEEGLHR